MVTLGKWEVKPGAVNVIPDEVNFSIDVRHPDEEAKQRLAAAIRARYEAISQERGLAVSNEITSESLPSGMDSALQSVLIQAAEKCEAELESDAKRSRA